MIELLKSLVSIPSHSREEGAVADFLENWMKSRGLKPFRKGNNIWLRKDVDSSLPTIMLNAHLDTVKPADGWLSDPYVPVCEDGRITALGTNDDGASVVALLGAFLKLSASEQPYNLIYSATAEEEVCGPNAVDSILPELGPVELAVVGEPTAMQMAVAEKGLMVLDCTARGVSGHAAREEGVNAIYKALADIEWFRNYRFPKVSEFLGTVKMTVTQISAGTQHNVVPAECKFVVDVRSNGLYSNPELLELIKSSVSCEVRERSTRLNSSSISLDHPIVRRGLELGLKAMGSPTTSNQSILPMTTIKIGPGESSRSHTAGEYILESEILGAIETYCKLLDKLKI